MGAVKQNTLLLAKLGQPTFTAIGPEVGRLFLYSVQYRGGKRVLLLLYDLFLFFFFFPRTIFPKIKYDRFGV